MGPFSVPFLTRNRDGHVYVLNIHTFSQADFDAVGEVLLCPRLLGLLEVPQSWANTVREAFNSFLDIEVKAPTRVAVQPLGDSGWMIHNYNREAVEIEVTAGIDCVADGFTGENMQFENGRLLLELSARSRKWLVK